MSEQDRSFEIIRRETEQIVRQLVPELARPLETVLTDGLRKIIGVLEDRQPAKKPRERGWWQRLILKWTIGAVVAYVLAIGSWFTFTAVNNVTIRTDAIARALDGNSEPARYRDGGNPSVAEALQSISASLETIAARMPTEPSGPSSDVR